MGGNRCLRWKATICYPDIDTTISCIFDNECIFSWNNWFKLCSGVAKSPEYFCLTIRLMETGIVRETKYGKTRSAQIKASVLILNVSNI